MEVFFTSVKFFIFSQVARVEVAGYTLHFREETWQEAPELICLLSADLCGYWTPSIKSLMTAQDENLISLLTNMVIKSPQNNRFSSSPLPPISEVNRGRSEVNKPSRCSSFTQQPNVKGQRVLGVITSLPTYFCVCGFFSVKFISNFKNSEHLVLKHKHKCVLTETHLTLSLSLSPCLSKKILTTAPGSSRAHRIVSTVS